MHPATAWTAARRWLWLLNRRRLHRRQRKRATAYADWCARYDTPGAPEFDLLRRRAGSLPCLTLLLDLNGTATAALDATLDSLRAQLHADWALRLLGHGDAAVEAWAAAAQAADARVRRFAGIEQAQADADWLAFTQAGDRWQPHALLLLAEAALKTGGEVGLAYADHDALDRDGQRCDPAFKCDWNAPLSWSHDWVGAPALWSGRMLRTAGNCMGAHDRLLKVGGALAAEAVRHVPHVLLHRDPQAAPPQADAAAVSADLARRGIAGRTAATPFGVRIHLELPDPPPLVSIVIPTRNGLDLLRRCVGGLQTLTDYPRLEIVIVDNGSDDPECLRYLAELQRDDQRFRVRRDDGPFNYAALNNAAVAECRGDIVLLLNNDIEIVEAGWLREMVGLALLPGVGAVGARLLYEDHTVQHAGVILGILGGCGHGLRRLPPEDGGYLGRARRLMALSAVTAACLAVRREHYLAVGGLDTEHFAVAFNDVDFCLRLQAMGLRNLYTPHAVLLHHEQASRGSDASGARQQRFLREHEAFRQRWGRLLERDPAYNPNLTLDSEQFGLAEPPRVRLDRPWFAASAG